MWMFYKYVPISQEKIIYFENKICATYYTVVNKFLIYLLLVLFIYTKKTWHIVKFS